MRDGRRDLGQLQRWMQTVIMHPDGVIEGVESEEARQHIDVTPEEIEQVITRSQALRAPERLAIYHRAYYARLLECLREEFAVLVQAVSQEVFDAFAFGYLQKYPSRSYTLNQLGTHFPRYLAETRPEADEGKDSSPSWPDFLIDLATLELTFNEVFDGPGVEGQQLLSGDQLLCIPAESWPEARLLAVPCLRLLALRYPVHDYFAAVRRKQDVTPPAPRETFLAITRRDYVVCHYPLSPPEHELLHALVAGESVGRAIDRLAQAADSDFGRLVADVRGWFRGWAARGFFQAVELG